MPGLDGFAVMKALRNDVRYASIPAVGLTASAMQGDRELALAAGFVDYITRPISLSLLRPRVLIAAPRLATMNLSPAAHALPHGHRQYDASDEPIA